MLELYKKMYATLVGRVDGSISLLTDIAAHAGPGDRQRILLAADGLRQALWEAEDMYLDAAEDE